VTRDGNGILQIYGKTYGANKYETILLCFAISEVSINSVELYEIQEGDLTTLPSPAREVILDLGKISIFTSDLSIERDEYEKNDSLRSPAFIYSLLDKYGDKKCALCECEIPQLVQGAHIWPVAEIKRASNITPEERLRSATDGDNGIWLCNNHHTMFDVNLIRIHNDGRTKRISNLRENDGKYVCDVTVNRQLPDRFLTPGLLRYLGKRNSVVDGNMFAFIE
jgi:hypothetical protein